MKLFVDDIRQPWEGWVLARTITEAIRILANQDVEIVSLDHDIACRLVKGSEHSSNETYEPVAWFLKCAAYNPGHLPKVQFHTGNPAGGKNMAYILGVDYDKTWVNYSTFGKEEV